MKDQVNLAKNRVIQVNLYFFLLKCKKNLESLEWFRFKVNLMCFRNKIVDV